MTMQTDFKKYGSSYSFGIDNDDHPIRLETLTSPSTSTFYRSTEALQKVRYHGEEKAEEEEVEAGEAGLGAWSTVAGAYVLVPMLNLQIIESEAGGLSNSVALGTYAVYCLVHPELIFELLATQMLSVYTKVGKEGSAAICLN